MSTLETTPEMRGIFNDWLASATNVKHERASIGRALVRDVASLEAENATLKQERDAHKLAYDKANRTLVSAALLAERDRFKASLMWISELSPNGINIGAAIQEAQRSLSPSETEEGG